LRPSRIFGRKNYYGSRAECELYSEYWLSGELAAMVWTFWATADQMGRNPMDYLTAYAQNGNQPLSPTALAAFLPPPIVNESVTATSSG
jgi:hypothetical protein